MFTEVTMCSRYNMFTEHIPVVGVVADVLIVGWTIRLLGQLHGTECRCLSRSSQLSCARAIMSVPADRHAG